jgi:hypothetical protein
MEEEFPNVRRGGGEQTAKKAGADVGFSDGIREGMDVLGGGRWQRVGREAGEVGEEEAYHQAEIGEKTWIFRRWATHDSSEFPEVQMMTESFEVLIASER